MIPLTQGSHELGSVFVLENKRFRTNKSCLSFANNNSLSGVIYLFTAIMVTIMESAPQAKSRLFTICYSVAYFRHIKVKIKLYYIKI